MKKAIQAISLFGFSTLFCLLFTECILRLINYPKVFLFNKDDSDYIQYDEQTGYKYLPNLNFTLKTDNYQVSVKTNSLGHREQELPPSSHQFRILVLGNSFSVGYGIEVNQRYSNQLNSMLNDPLDRAMVYNAAVSGYSLKQSIASGKDMLDLIHPDFVIMGLFIEGLSRIADPYVYHEGFSVRHSKIKYTLSQNDRMLIVHFQDQTLRTIESFLIGHSVFYNFLVSKLSALKLSLRENHRESDLEMGQACKMIHSFKLYFDTENIRLIILPILQHDKNKKFSAKDVNQYQKMKSFCMQNGILFADILPDMQKQLLSTTFWINNDQHWNEEAHQIAARSIFNILSDD